MEIAAFFLALVCVSLNAKGHVLTWPFSIASSATYAWVFYDSGLFGDAALQFIFISLAIYAWWCWTRKMDSGTLAKQFGHAPKKMIAVCLLAWLVLFIAIKFVLVNYTSSVVPNADALLTAGSIMATLMSAQKWIENWLLWMILNPIYIALYIYMDLYLTAGLYGLFVVLCFWGWRQWSQKIMAQDLLQSDKH
ncbi:nicotinamide mononucleotide transporter [Polynucleobacter sp. 30F-ANTBAC]|jgi:nicotinamide mononucleotide transporter|uniref:nicotinamide riboside transporter PnuC n=1 Tax=Polynucleobacter sp. 30F-ANTBAC TaxID=2689095 RepID=UPI001C0C38F2|nr:nicotinamide riboside transporter PnuC [Polynucleobacter sp. 30F-ANTBAC]MBU3599023.1 nicotinamide mononucleotide transporter [Polynucleobacter sp. 30F-ANTBAC]